MQSHNIPYKGAHELGIQILFLSFRQERFPACTWCSSSGFCASTPEPITAYLLANPNRMQPAREFGAVRVWGLGLFSPGLFWLVLDGVDRMLSRQQGEVTQWL